MPTLPLPTIEVCKFDDLPEGLGRAFRVGGRTIAIFRTRAGRVFAVDGLCPHKGGPLADGMLAGNQVVCPYHTFRYASDTGECDQPGVCSVAVHPVTVAGGNVYLEVAPA